MRLIKFTTIGLRLSGYGAAEVVINFTEELRHTETDPTCKIHESHCTSRKNTRPKVEISLPFRAAWLEQSGIIVIRYSVHECCHISCTSAFSLPSQFRLYSLHFSCQQSTVHSLLPTHDLDND